MKKIRKKIIILLLTTILILTISQTTSKPIKINTETNKPFFIASINTNGTGFCKADQEFTGTPLTILLDISYENDPDAKTTIKPLIGEEKIITGNHRVMLFFYKGQKNLPLLLSEGNCNLEGKSFFIIVEN